MTETSSLQSGDGMITGLRVLVADEDVQALQSTVRALEDLGHRVTDYAVEVREAAQRIAEGDPDVSVVTVHEDHGHALDLVEELTESARGPVIMVCAPNQGDFLSRAAARGIDGFARSEDPGEIQGAIEVAVRRRRQGEELAQQVDQLETALERRSVIERAKGILMERHGVDDRTAFTLLRDQARRTGRKVVDLAASVVEGHPLLPRRRDDD